MKNILSYTIKGTVYVTNNGGEKWESLRNDMKKIVLGLNVGIKKKKDKIKFDGITNVIQHKRDKNVLIFIGSENISFKTTNCGRSISYFTHKKGIHKVSFHPTNSNKILFLIVKKRNCLTPLCLPNRSLYLSTNFLIDFKKVEKNILDFTWAYIPETAQKGFPIDRIILLKQIEGKFNE